MSRLHGSLTRGRVRAPCGVAALTFVIACSNGDGDAVSYGADVRPILQDRCVICHYDGRDERSLEHPFDANLLGMFTQQNRFWENGHGGRQYNVVPGDPDNSHLMQKITDRELLPEACAPDDCPAGDHGVFMPPRPPPMTDAQIETVSQWIRDGATDTPFFRDAVVPIFGEKDNFRDNFCRRGGYGFGCILCGRCHYDGAPTYPVLELPPLNADNIDDLIAEWRSNLVGVSAQYRPDLQLIVPGDPDASFLVMKMKAKSSSTAFGAPMPYGYEPLSEAQVEIVRTWIAEGARND